ncbi:hypothetical protein ACFQ4O_16875, partial [Methylopila musalis]
MKTSRRLAFLLGGALVAGALAAPVTGVAPAEARETRPLFSLPKQFRAPWSESGRPARKTRRSPRAARVA